LISVQSMQRSQMGLVCHLTKSLEVDARYWSLFAILNPTVPVGTGYLTAQALWHIPNETSPNTILRLPDRLSCFLPIEIGVNVCCYQRKWAHQVQNQH
jgi:hypothetical protein